MPPATCAKKFVLNAASLVIHFAHGGLLMTGLLMTILIAGYANGALDAYLPVRNAYAEAVQEPAAEVEDDAVEETAAVVKVSEEPPLRPEMRTVAAYLGRKYRVARVAIEPVVSAAQAAGSKVGLDPLLIIAVAAVESSFNPFAESAVGAQGLMQVVPRFHKDKLPKQGAASEALLDPHTNIHVGARVLKEAIARAGSLEAGLQQYAGAPADADSQYAAKVMAEKHRLEAAIHQQAARRSRAVGA
jgi:soluble lytic murein transglycosylase-like protein